MPLTIAGPRRPAFIAYATRFFTLLSHHDWDAALGLFDRPNSYGTTWTREVIVRVINETFGPGTGFAIDHPGPLVFTDPLTLPPPGTSLLSLRVMPRKYEVVYPVPLCGVWSDLSAIIQFHHAASRHYLAVLDDLHVL